MQFCDMLIQFKFYLFVKVEFIFEIRIKSEFSEIKLQSLK